MSMQANPWDNDPVVGKVTSAPTPIMGAAKPADPFREEDQQMQRDAAARADRNAERADATANRAIESNERTAGNKQYDNTLKLRSDYDALPAVKEYRVAVSQLAAGLKASPDATGDNALIYAYAKAMDPGSVVRESEMGMAAAGASVVESTAANLKKQFGIEGGGQLDPKIRERLRREMLHKVTATKAGYDAQRQRFIADASAFGIDPARVIGNHDGDPFVEQFRAYDASRRSDDNQQPNPGVNPDGSVDLPDVGYASPPNGGLSVPAQLGEATGNVLAGMGQGLAAIPDMATNALGAVMAVPADALGFDNAAAAWRNPTTIGGMIEKAVPTPQDNVGAGVRMASQFGGGVAGFPQRAAQAVTNRIVGAVPQRLNAMSGNPVMQAAQRQGVELLPADVGGQAVKGMTSAAAQAPFSRGAVTAVSRRAATQMEAAARRTADDVGDVLPEDEAGEIVRRGGNKFISETRNRASRWYDKAHELAAGVKIMPQRAIQVIDDHIAQKSQAGEMSGEMVGELEKVKRSLAQEGGITAVGMREARTILGGLARSDKLRNTDAKRIFGQVLDAASDDMAESLAQAGKQGASRMFRRADALWRDRITEIDEVLEPVIGKAKSGEDIVAAVEGMARGGRGGVVRLQRMLATLPAEEKGDITATIIDRMGRATPGVQDDVGGIFSSNSFLTNWNKMSNKGKAALFGGGETRRNLDDLAKIAAARRDTAAIASKSNTPMGITANATPYAALSVASPPAAALGVAMQYATGRLLAAPAFTRWLARMPQGERPLAQHIKRLSTIASQNPALSDEIGVIARAMNDNVARAGSLAAQSPDPRVQQ